MSLSRTRRSIIETTGQTVAVESPAARYIRDIYSEKIAQGKPVVSIELFPPRTIKSEESLYKRALPRLVTAKPDFFSVTYGAGGSTHEKTLEVVNHLQRQHGITGMAHLTCISSTINEIENYLGSAKKLGIKNILALRGDAPHDDPNFIESDHGLRYSYQLIDFIKSQGNFSIGAAGFPECHMTCTEGKHVDRKRLKNKIEHGAEFVLTQLFFDNTDYFEFLDYMTGKLGVKVPIIPGILPIISTEQVKRFTALCGATLPEHVAAQLDTIGDNSNAIVEFGIDFATRQCEELIQNGAPGLHLYSLNKSRSSLKILQNLGLT